MKVIVLSAVVAVAMTGPVFADAAEFARQHFAQDEEGFERISALSETSQGDVAAVIAHFAQDYETGDGPRVRVPASAGEVISTSNSALGSFAAEKLDD